MFAELLNSVVESGAALSPSVRVRVCVCATVLQTAHVARMAAQITLSSWNSAARPV